MLSAPNPVLLIILLAGISPISYGQFNQQKRPVVDDSVSHTKKNLQEQQPDYPGGYESMMKFLKRKVKMPKSAKRIKINGAVYVRFMVKKDGTVSNLSIERSLQIDCDAEAIRAMRSMPKWTPGRINGEAVDVWFILPIKFKSK
jgi:TonB family protein